MSQFDQLHFPPAPTSSSLPSPFGRRPCACFFRPPSCDARIPLSLDVWILGTPGVLVLVFAPLRLRSCLPSSRIAIANDPTLGSFDEGVNGSVRSLFKLGPPPPRSLPCRAQSSELGGPARWQPDRRC